MAKYGLAFKYLRPWQGFMGLHQSLKPCRNGDRHMGSPRQPVGCLSRGNAQLFRQIGFRPAEEHEAVSETVGDHASRLPEAVADEMCFAARYIIVDAAVRRFQPADSAMSSKPSSHGLSTSRHSLSCARISLEGCVGAARVPMPGVIFIGNPEEFSW